MIGIIDYKLGNLTSVKNALDKLGVPSFITDDSLKLQDASGLILPGVGAAGTGMKNLKAKKLDQLIIEEIKKGKPFLGICLGMQLLFEKGNEGEEVYGLGILDGTVERFQDLKVPHMGWNQVKCSTSDSALFAGIPDSSNFYFCHSYYVKPKYPQDVAAQTDYGIKFVSSITRQNVFGVQFHPEKSQTLGLSVLKNFVEGT